MGTYVYTIQAPRKALNIDGETVAMVDFSCRESALRPWTGRGYPLDMVVAAKKRAWAAKGGTPELFAADEDYSSVYRKVGGCLISMFDTPDFPHDEVVGFLHGKRILDSYFEVLLGEQDHAAFTVHESWKVTSEQQVKSLLGDTMPSGYRVTRYFVNGGKVNVEAAFTEKAL